MPIWVNSDGLVVKLGTIEATAGRAGQYADPLGGQHITEIAVNLVDVVLADGGTILDYNTIIPKGANIQKVEVETLVAVTGTSAVLNIGLSRSDLTTELDWNGLGTAAALTQTAMAAKGTVLTYIKGTANAGALLGTALANNGILTADYDTAAFTAGRIAIRVYWSVAL